MNFDKLIWTFAEWCLNLPLLEMASERNEKLSKIESKNQTINEHLFKWYLMPNSRDRNHLLEEIDDRFFEIMNLKWGKNKRFRRDEYFNLLYNRFFLKDQTHIDYKKITRIFTTIENKYQPETQIDWTIDSFVEKAGAFLNEISSLLESGDYDRVELEELINKYLKTN